MSLKCLLFGHKTKSKTIKSREWYGMYSPKGGTLVTKRIHICERCGEDLTEEMEMRAYYEYQRKELEIYARGQLEEARQRRY